MTGQERKRKGEIQTRWAEKTKIESNKRGGKTTASKKSEKKKTKFCPNLWSKPK
jgi:hypothetical protein